MPICEIIDAVFTFLIGQLGLEIFRPFADFLWDLVGCNIG